MLLNRRSAPDLSVGQNLTRLSYSGRRRGNSLHETKRHSENESDEFKWMQFSEKSTREKRKQNVDRPTAAHHYGESPSQYENLRRKLGDFILTDSGTSRSVGRGFASYRLSDTSLTCTEVGFIHKMADNLIDSTGGDVGLTNVSLHIPANSLKHQVSIAVTEIYMKQVRKQQIAYCGLSAILEPNIRVKLQPCLSNQSSLESKMSQFQKKRVF